MKYALPVEEWLLTDQGAFIRAGLPIGPCISEAMFAMSAGSDTTAATIRCTMLHLMTSPRIYHKFKQIVREAVKEGKVSSPITHDEARKIPYVQVRSKSSAYNQEDHELTFVRP